MPRTSAFKRALRRLIGLPHERGIYTRHPEFNPRKARGKLERDPATGQTRYVPEDAEDGFADLERGDVRSHDTLPRTGIDAPLALLEEKVARISAAGEGDETELSASRSWRSTSTPWGERRRKAGTRRARRAEKKSARRARLARSLRGGKSSYTRAASCERVYV